MNQVESKYDISTYTDTELYDILDLNNPTDRELEAKIIHMINKYANMQNESGYKLAVFFQNIYYHFFDTQEGDNEADEDEIKEGFTQQDGITISTDSTKQQSKIGNELTNIKTNKPATANEIINTQVLEYKPDKFGLNPLLKETIRRIISIDSRYRDNKAYTLDTNFTLNLSEPLKDVVSLTLESVQIPISWYTISTSYGANFFMLKGRSEGINSVETLGAHDLKVEIAPGNYVLDSTKSNCITTTIQNALTDVSNTNPDINFGNTAINYNISTGKTTLTLDIQKSFNEQNFYIDFSNSWSPSVPTTDTNIRTKTIASYLGFNNSRYTPYSISSNQQYLTNQNITNSKSIYTFQVDNSNNTFHIVQYMGSSYLSNTEIITRYPVTIENGTYSRNMLYNYLNGKLKYDSPFLDETYSGLEQISVTDPSNISNGYTYYKMNIKLNRNKVKPVPNSKVAVIFPDESNLNRPTVWTLLQTQEYPSCFYYDNIINETNTIYAESPCVQSSITVDDSTYIYFKCTSPANYAQKKDTSGNIIFAGNDIKIPIPQNNYSLTSFINSLNTLLYNNPIFISTTQAYISQDTFNLNIDMLNQYNNDSWTVYIDPNGLLSQVFGITSGITKLIDLSNNKYQLKIDNYIPGNYGNTFQTPSSQQILQYYPNTSLKLGNQNDIAHNLTTSRTTFAGWYDLLNQINYEFNNFAIYDASTNTTQYPLSNSSLTSVITGTTISITLTLNINYYLTENNYEVSFHDTAIGIDDDITNAKNTWYNLNINYSYNINNDLSSLFFNPSVKVLTGNSPISLVGITITSANNTFNIIPYSDIYGINIPSNYFSIQIPESNIPYTTETLTHTINIIMFSNPKLFGSSVTTYYKNNQAYISLSLNINIIYTTSDYDLVFYDTTSFIKCYTGSTSVKNTSWDSTLGWVLGFHDYTDYTLTKENQTTTIINNETNTVSQYYLDSVNGKYTYQDIYKNYNQLLNTIINITGDTATTTSMYTYFLIVINDYIQNHLNDGLVRITSKETSLPLPSYASKLTNTICDPTTNTVTTVSTTNKDGLTQKQLYALNQTIISQQQQSNNTIYSAGPNIQDVFAIISAPPAGQSPGTYYTLTGGNLQNQSRSYFGPVTINRLSIKLQNDKGEIVDLNGSSWSMTLLCEQLYHK